MVATSDGTGTGADGTGPAGDGDGAERWSAIGSRSPIMVTAVDLLLVELPFRSPLTTAQGRHVRRPLVLVRITGHIDTGAAGSRTVVGWGECAALADATYDPEDVTRSMATLEAALVPALFAEVERLGGSGAQLPSPSALEGVRRAAPYDPLAFAALEMAVADSHLRAEHLGFADVLGVQGHSLEVGAVVGQTASTDALVEQVSVVADQGCTRVKVKIGPGWDHEPLGALRRQLPDLRVQVDANGAYTAADLEHLAGLDRYHLLCIEQPLPKDDLAGHARLARRMATPICLDESLDSPEAVVHALELGACSVVCVKPSRLGGLGRALQVMDHCTRRAVPMWIGGMFESSYARGVNRVLGALPGCSWPGDLGPSLAYLEEDLVTGFPAPRGGTGDRWTVTLGPEAGMGPVPDPDVVERLTRKRHHCTPTHG